MEASRGHPLDPSWAGAELNFLHAWGPEVFKRHCSVQPRQLGYWTSRTLSLPLQWGDCVWAVGPCRLQSRTSASARVSDTSAYSSVVWRLLCPSLLRMVPVLTPPLTISVAWMWQNWWMHNCPDAPPVTSARTVGPAWPASCSPRSHRGEPARRARVLQLWP